jgi:hypothetical protein
MPALLTNGSALVWIGLGMVETAPFPASIKAFGDSLDKGGMKHAYFESPGTAHEWLAPGAAIYMISRPENSSLTAETGLLSDAG